MTFISAFYTGFCSWARSTPPMGNPRLMIEKKLLKYFEKGYNNIQLRLVGREAIKKINFLKIFIERFKPECTSYFPG